jgi:TetR/AcrR family tetracycline transcriptional repressor
VTTRPAVDDQRIKLSRERVLRAALGYIDEHGLDALSMHKLGDCLDVRAMSLYNHVANKDDLLDGVVEAVWAEVESAAPADADWREGYRLLARALRDAVQRHPNTAPLITSRQIIPEAALRTVRAHILAATASGVPEDHAYALLRTLTSYALGYAVASVSWGLRCPGAPTVADLLRPGIPDELAAVAEVFCGQSDPDAEFELGLDLMVGGIR